MDFTLIPICYDKEHIMENNYKDDEYAEYYCNICNEKGIAYICLNCEYFRCSKCHLEILKEKRLDDAIKSSMTKKITERLQEEQYKLNKDGLDKWCVDLLKDTGELYYYNINTKSISYDYPRVFKIPRFSLTPPPTPPSSPDLSHDQEESFYGSAMNMYRCMKDKMTQLHL